MSLTFVVGTGRCGSTMLSRILHLHPDVLSISELFHLLLDERGSIITRDLNGQELWQLLTATQPGLDGLIQVGLKPPEVAYPYEAGRFRADRGVPGVCHHVLSLISDRPDELFDRLAAEVPAWPKRPAAQQYRALFALLAEALGRRVVVERSAGSIAQIPSLREQFPEARYALIYRDGPDCALSMSRHSAIRLLAMGYAAALRTPSLRENATQQELIAAAPAEFEGLLAPPFDRDRFMTYPIPLRIFGWMWSTTTREGVSALLDVPAERWMSMKYEQLTREPRVHLIRLAELLEVDPRPEWLDKAESLVDPGRTGSAQTQLDQEQLAELVAACAPGTRSIAALEAWAK